MKLNKKIQHLEVPMRMRHLRISDEGYPVPWFVPFINDKPEFRGMDGEKLRIAVRHEMCWLCGQKLGVHKTFPIGPMCVITRTISEPSSHLSCAEYGVQACPFLTQPRMRRNEKDKPKGHVAGIGIARNPGVTALWTTKTFTVVKAPNGGVLFRLGDPEHVAFWAEGRHATRQEVVDSMESGYPLLKEHAQTPAEIAELGEYYNAAQKYLPE